MALIDVQTDNFFFVKSLLSTTEYVQIFTLLKNICVSLRTIQSGYSNYALCSCFAAGEFGQNIQQDKMTSLSPGSGGATLYKNPSDQTVLRNKKNL